MAVKFVACEYILLFLSTAGWDCVLFDCFLFTLWYFCGVHIGLCCIIRKVNNLLNFADLMPFMVRPTLTGSQLCNRIWA